MSVTRGRVTRTPAQPARPSHDRAGDDCKSLERSGGRAIGLFRVIVVVGGERTVQMTMPFVRAPHPGEILALPEGRVVTVRHVIEARHNGVCGIILAWDG